jgi:hypothetical protein
MNRFHQLFQAGVAVLFCACITSFASAAVLEYGDRDVLGTGIYPGDPTAGATLEGLAADVVTFGAPPLAHGFPFAPEGDDYTATDQIFVGSVQTGFHDGYSGATERLNGAQAFHLDYAALVPTGHTITSLTLGIAADDFQFPVFGQPFIVEVNGLAAPVLTGVLNSVDQTSPVVQYFSIGISPAILFATHELKLKIDQGGDGGDGWAIDFLTVGVITVPEPCTIVLAGLAVLGLRRIRRR